MTAPPAKSWLSRRYALSHRKPQVNGPRVVRFPLPGDVRPSHPLPKSRFTVFPIIDSLGQATALGPARRTKRIARRLKLGTTLALASD